MCFKSLNIRSGLRSFSTLTGKSMKGSKKATFIRTIAAWRAAGDIGTNMPPKLPPELQEREEHFERLL